MQSFCLLPWMYHFDSFVTFYKFRFTQVLSFVFIFEIIAEIHFITSRQMYLVEDLPFAWRSMKMLRFFSPNAIYIFFARNFSLCSPFIWMCMSILAINVPYVRMMKLIFLLIRLYFLRCDCSFAENSDEESWQKDRILFHIVFVPDNFYLGFFIFASKRARKCAQMCWSVCTHTIRATELKAKHKTAFATSFFSLVFNILLRICTLRYLLVA